MLKFWADLSLVCATLKITAWQKLTNKIVKSIIPTKLPLIFYSPPFHLLKLD
ncbi:hypothetical protein CDIMF43_280021 [Carnobacterium divergens]|nr:hypothetical protein CDIMF43_280021 [Carnobacterium divergens]